MDLILGDQLAIRQSENGITIFGELIRQDEESLLIKENGPKSGNRFIIPKDKIFNIEILQGGDDS